MHDITICSADVKIGRAGEAPEWDFWINLDLEKTPAVFHLKYHPIWQCIIDQFWLYFSVSSDDYIFIAYEHDM